MASATLLNFFTLRRASVLTQRGVERRALEPLLERAHQERRAAISLWSLGQRAEALRLITRALRSSLEAAAKATSKDASDPTSCLAELGIEDARQLAAEVDLIHAADVPALDRDFTEAHASTYADALKAVNTIVQAIDEGLLTPRAARITRVQRISGTLLVLACSLALGLWVRDLMLRETVTGSGSHKRTLGVGNIVDRNRDTEWVLPENTPGWAEITPHAPVRLSGVRIVNGTHAPDDDRLTREVRVTVMSEDGEAQTLNVTFAEHAKPGETREVTFKAEGVIKVRLDVINWYKAGGAIAEVELLSD